MPRPKKTQKQAVPIGERLRAAREKAGLSRIKLASLMGVSRDALASWERGRRVLRGSALVLAEALIKGDIDRQPDNGDCDVAPFWADTFRHACTA